MAGHGRQLAATLILGIFTGTGIAALVLPAPTRDTVVPPVVADVVSTTTPVTSAPTQPAPEPTVPGDELAAAVSSALGDAGSAAWVVEGELNDKLAPEIVRVLIDNGAVLNVVDPAPADEGLTPDGS